MTGNVGQVIERSVLVAVAFLGSLFLGRLAAEHSWLDVGLLLFVMSLIVAWWLPRLHIAILLLSFSIPSLLPIMKRAAAGGVGLNLFDPCLGATAVVVVFKFGSYLLARGNRTPPAIILFVGLMAWLCVEMVRSYGSYPIISIVGEARTYYGSLALIPYIIVQTRAPEARLKMLQLVMRVSLFSIVLILLFSAVFYKGLGGLHQTAGSISLQLTYAVFTLILFRELRVLPMPTWVVMSVAVVGFGLSIAPVHRSVLLALAVLVVMSVFARRLSIGRLMVLGVVALSVIFIAGLLSVQAGYDPVSFVKGQSRAFYDPIEDANSHWRMVLWEGAIADIRGSPVAGMGLGRHFQLVGVQGDIVTTSPHNAYVTIAYHLGGVGLLIYLGFVITLFRSFVLLSKSRELLASDRACAELSMLVLVSSHGFFLAYSIEHNFVTFVLIGLGCSVLANRAGQREEEVVEDV